MLTNDEESSEAIDLVGSSNVHISTPEEIAAKIDQKAIRLSALLRELDNHPVEMPAAVSELLQASLEMLACRISATHSQLQASLDRQTVPV